MLISNQKHHFLTIRLIFWKYCHTIIYRFYSVVVIFAPCISQMEWNLENEWEPPSRDKIIFFKFCLSVTVHEDTLYVLSMNPISTANFSMLFTLLQHFSPVFIHFHLWLPLFFSSLNYISFLLNICTFTLSQRKHRPIRKPLPTLASELSNSPHKSLRIGKWKICWFLIVRYLLVYP